MMPTFRFNIKSSFLKLLCTLARLCEWTPLQPLRLECFGLTFPCIPAFTTSINHFSRVGQHNKWKGKYITITLCSTSSSSTSLRISLPLPSSLPIRIRYIIGGESHCSSGNGRTVCLARPHHTPLMLPPQLIEDAAKILIRFWPPQIAVQVGSIVNTPKW